MLNYFYIYCKLQLYPLWERLSLLLLLLLATTTTTATAAAAAKSTTATATTNTTATTGITAAIFNFFKGLSRSLRV